MKTSEKYQRRFLYIAVIYRAAVKESLSLYVLYCVKRRFFVSLKHRNIYNVVVKFVIEIQNRLSFCGFRPTAVCKGIPHTIHCPWRVSLLLKLHVFDFILFFFAVEIGIGPTQSQLHKHDLLLRLMPVLKLTGHMSQSVTAVMDNLDMDPNSCTQPNPKHSCT